MVRKSTSAKAAPDETDRIEWILAGVAAIAIVLLFGFLAFEAIVKTGTAPSMELKVVGSREVLGQTYVEIAVRNLGHDAAADVEIEGMSDDEVVAHATLDYAPAESVSQVTLVFDGPVTAQLLKLQVVGFRVLR